MYNFNTKGRWEKMDVAITYLQANDGTCTSEGERHVKSLPCLSVVMAVTGWYSIALDGGESQEIPAGHAFIAPAGVMQDIVHHVDPAVGYMRMKWLFLQAQFQSLYTQDDRFSFPLCLPEAYCAEMSGYIDALLTEDETPAGVCRRQAIGFSVLSLLLQTATPKPPIVGSVYPAIAYLRAHYAEKLPVALLAAQCGLSPSAFLRHFKQETGATPSSFLMNYRLNTAAIQLENSEADVQTIAERTGFYDQFYFSRCFRKKYGVPPLQYRRQTQYAAANNGHAGGGECGGQDGKMASYRRRRIDRAAEENW